VASEAVRRGLEADPHITAALRALDALDTAYVEIGCAGPGEPVGHIALRRFDRCGRLLHGALDRRVVGITVAQLRRVRHLVALASAPGDPALVAAGLRTGIVRTLITDELTARALAAHA
jgi:DNA-binding transcriptional regulator LsrR (DeoR family)